MTSPAAAVEFMMPSPPAAAEFIVDHPALALPLALLVYLGLVLAGVKVTRELLFTVAAVPGLAILWSWSFYWPLAGTWEDIFLSSIFLIPTNSLAPFLMLVTVVSVLHRKLRRRASAKITTFDQIILGLVALAYCWDQVVATGLQTY
jgi:hypothetical protein